MTETRPPNLESIYQWLEIAASIIAVAAIIFAIWSVFSGRTSRPPERNASASLPGEFYPSLGNPHLPDPAPWGILKSPVDDRKLLENMEQGGVVIWYDPSSSTGLVASLRAVVGSYVDQGMLLVMVPYPDVDSKVVLGSWTRLMKLDRFDLDRFDLGRFDEEAIRTCS